MVVAPFSLAHAVSVPIFLLYNILSLTTGIWTWPWDLVKIFRTLTQDCFKLNTTLLSKKEVMIPFKEGRNNGDIYKYEVSAIKRKRM